MTSRPRVLLALALACNADPPNMLQEPPRAPAPAPAPPALDPHAELLAASALPDPLPVPLPDDPFGVTIHRLSNGLSVYISTDRSAPRIAAWIAFRAGSRHDPAHSTGLAHYLEHMMFKGTARLGTLDAAAEAPHLAEIAGLYDQLAAAAASERAEILARIDRANQRVAAAAIPNEYDRLYAQLGITDLNAFTGEDMTVYTADVPAARLDVWAEIEAERVQRPIFRLFLPEIEAVYEEKNMSLDAPDERVEELMREALFPGHPYGTQTTLGSVLHLKTPALADMVAFHRRHYRPNNAAIILAGDVDADAALPILERAFGPWQPAAPEPTPPADLAGPRGRQERELLADGEQTLTLAFRTVPIGHPDEAALTALDHVLGHEVGGLLTTRLLLTHQLPDADAYGARMREGGYLALTGVARAGQRPADVERLLRDVIDVARSGAITQADVDAAVLHETITEEEALESNEERADRMMAAFTSFQAWPDLVRRRAALRALTPQDLTRVARTYLGDDHVVVARRRGRFDAPQIDKPRITAVAIDSARESPYAREVLARPTPEPAAEVLVEGRDYVRKDLSCGTLLYAPNERGSLFSLDLRYDFGTRQRPLLGHALALLERSGAGPQDAAALQQRLYRLGTRVDFGIDADRTDIQVSGTGRNLAESLRLLEDWLRAPNFRPDDLAALLDNTLSTRRDEEDDPDDLAAALRAYAAFGADSPVLARPSDRRLRRARASDLVAELRALLDAEHTTLFFGPDVPEAISLGAGRKTAARPARRYRPVAGAELYFLHKDVAQTRVSIVLPQPPAPPEAQAFAELITAVLSGDMGGLAYQEIREARGLAYHAGAYFDLGPRRDDDAAMIGTLGTQGDKTVDALTLLLDLMRRPDVTPERLAAARLSLVREHASARIPPRARPGWVKSWLDRGETVDPRPALRQALADTDAASLQDDLRRFADAPAIIAVLGDRRRIDLAALRRIARVVEVEPRQLFPYARP